MYNDFDIIDHIISFILTHLSSRLRHADRCVVLIGVRSALLLYPTWGLQAVYMCSSNSTGCAKCLNNAIVSNSSRDTGIMLNLPVLLDSPLRNQGLCYDLPAQVAEVGDGFLARVMQTCFRDSCDLALWDCANNANCKVLGFPRGGTAGGICGAGDCAGTTTIAFNFSSVLAIGDNSMFNKTVQQCAISSETMPDLLPVGLATAADGATCKREISRCAGDPGCWSCMHQFSSVNAGGGYPQNVSRALVNTWDICSKPPISTDRQSLVTSCGFRIGELGRCFTAFEGCLNSTGGGCGRCAKRLAAVSPSGAQFELAFGVMKTRSCRGETDNDNDTEADGDVRAPAALTTMVKACTSSEAAGAMHSFAAGLWCALEALQCADDPSCNACLAYAPTAEHVTIRYVPSCKYSIRNMTTICGRFKPGYVEFLSCPGAVNVNNILSYITSAIGVVAFTVALWALAVIYGYHKDKRSLRERILIGVFLGNLCYSGVNIMPISLEETGSNVCGDPVYGREQAIIRGIWFFAKYTSKAPPTHPHTPTSTHTHTIPYIWTISTSANVIANAFGLLISLSLPHPGYAQ